jgi:hypothetical protein
MHLVFYAPVAPNAVGEGLCRLAKRSDVVTGFGGDFNMLARCTWRSDRLESGFVALGNQECLSNR